MTTRLMKFALLSASIILTLSYNRAVLAERLVAHVCWMGTDCVKEYLISSVRHNDEVKAHTRTVFFENGKITKRRTESRTLSCKTKPPEDHHNAVEYTLWMDLCKGQKTQWSPEVELSGTAPLNIPKQFQGAWDGSPELCKGESSDLRIRVKSNKINYYEAVCLLKKVIASDRYRFSGSFDCEGEGHKWTYNILLKLDAGKLISKFNNPSFSYPALSRCK